MQDVPATVVSSAWTARDWLGAAMARCAVGRMHYAVAPGLYAIGRPTPDSPVFASANYKLSFDHLRRALAGRDGWILVLDTKGINVWCAAGKGTFGTEEVVARVEAVGLADVVAHRKLVLPQLGAPGVSAPEVRKRTGFRVVYGPVRAADLPAFLDAGDAGDARDAARAVRAARPAGAGAGGGGDRRAFGAARRARVLRARRAGAGRVVGGADAERRPAERGPLPDRVPGLGGAHARAAAVAAGAGVRTEGRVVGAALDVGLLLFTRAHPAYFGGTVSLVGWLLIIPALASFLGMNFTGSSTYTSLSGVQREMRTAVPLQAACALGGVAFYLVGRFV